MKTEKTLIEMLKFHSDVPHESVVERNGEKKVYRYDPESALFVEMVIEERGFKKTVATPLPAEAAVPTSGWVQVPVDAEEDVMTMPAELVHLKVPRLMGERLTSPEWIPRIPGESSHILRELLRDESPRISPATRRRNSPQEERSVEPPPPPKPVSTLHQIKVKVLPTPKKRQRRIPKPEPVTVHAPKPLKIIRRRGEEEQKVFETGPRHIPEAVLDGVDKKGASEDGGGKFE